MKNKKILGVFGNVAFFGQERANLQVFELLRDSGYELLLAVNDLGFQWHLQPEIEARDLPYTKIRFSWNLVKTLNFKRLKSYVINIPSSNYQLYKLIKSYRPDYIHVCNDTHVMTLLPILLFNKTKLIYRLGDEPSSHLSKLHKFLWRSVIIPRVDRFVCNANFIANKLIELSCPKEKITIIYNFAPKRLAQENDQSLPIKNSSLITFTFIGQLSKDKGIDVLISAFIIHAHKYRNSRLLIAGSLNQNRAFAEGLQQQVSSANLEDRVVFLDQIKNISKLFEITDINIIPSVYEEPLSNVLTEAKIHNRASIIFPSGGLTELVTHKGNGYITPDKSIESLKIAMQYYFDNTELILKHGEAAKNSIDSLGISYVNFKQKWLEVYE